MINTHLVLVSLSVYTFDMSKTMFEDKDSVSMRMRGHATLVVGRDAGCIAGQTGTYLVWQRHRNPKRTSTGGISYESFRYWRDRLYRLRHRP